MNIEGETRSTMHERTSEVGLDVGEQAGGGGVDVGEHATLAPRSGAVAGPRRESVTWRFGGRKTHRDHRAGAEGEGGRGWRR